MAQAKDPSPVKLIIGAIFASEGILIKAKETLARKFGPVDFQSESVPFDCTSYYEKEMGPNLKRQFLSFKKLIRPERLAAIKLYTNGLERRLSRERRTTSHERSRTINLDPGYISASKLVLATCKNYSHRVYLDKGIYAEVTLNFQNGTFAAWPWTYPDYKSDGYIQSFNTIRQAYIEQLKV